jgi:hypothetical protein
MPVIQANAHEKTGPGIRLKIFLKNCCRNSTNVFIFAAAFTAKFIFRLRKKVAWMGFDSYLCIPEFTSRSLKN